MEPRMDKTTPLRHFPRWLMEEHDLSSHFNALLSSGKAGEVRARIQREPATLQAVLELLANARTPLSGRVGIGVVMEDLAGSAILQQQVDALGKISQHPDARVRADACYYLGLSGADRARPYLQARLQDQDAAVQEVAADALGDLGLHAFTNPSG